MDDQDRIPISALNQFEYCQRRCALIHIEGVFVDNEHTLMGTLAHEHADFPGYECADGVTALRALPLFSDRLGLAGRADIVELRDGVPFPVEYKKGPRRKFSNDDVQLCAQGLCLEEMFRCHVPAGAVFHVTSRRRREVAFTPALRAQTIEAIDRLRAFLARGATPPAQLTPRCEECSLRGTCMPELAARASRYRQLLQQLWTSDGD